MLKICSEDVAFSEMIYKGAPPLQLVMHQLFHSYGQKWHRIVVVRPIYLGVC